MCRVVNTAMASNVLCMVEHLSAGHILFDTELYFGRLSLISTCRTGPYMVIFDSTFFI